LVASPSARRPPPAHLFRARSAALAMDFWAGWCGGVAGVLVSHPLDVLRTRQATNALSLRRTAQALLREPRGFFGMYRGVYSPCCSVGLEKCIALGVYKWCLGGEASPTTSHAVAASAVAGTAAGLTLGPVEVVKTRAMTAFAPAKEGRAPGWLSLLRMELCALSRLSIRDAARSTGLICLRDGYGTVWFLVPYECIKRAVQSRLPGDSASTLPAMVAGMVCGPIGWLSIYPLEVYRIRTLQAEAASPRGAGIRAQLSVVLANVRQIHASGGGGLQGLGIWFRGFAGVSLLSCLKMPVTMAIFEGMRSWSR